MPLDDDFWADRTTDKENKVENEHLEESAEATSAFKGVGLAISDNAIDFAIVEFDGAGNAYALPVDYDQLAQFGRLINAVTE